MLDPWRIDSLKDGGAVSYPGVVASRYETAWPAWQVVDRRYDDLKRGAYSPGSAAKNIVCRRAARQSERVRFISRSPPVSTLSGSHRTRQSQCSRPCKRNEFRPRDAPRCSLSRVVPDRIRTTASEVEIACELPEKLSNYVECYAANNSKNDAPPAVDSRAAFPKLINLDGRLQGNRVGYCSMAVAQPGLWVC